VCGVLATAPDRLSGRAIKQKLADSDHPRDAIDAALKLGLSTGVLRVEDGSNNAKLYSRVRVSGSVPTVPSGHANECPAPYREPDTRTPPGGPLLFGLPAVMADRAPPDWVTERVEPDASDPIGAHDEEDGDA
jgi:hypothetical protein